MMIKYVEWNQRGTELLNGVRELLLDMSLNNSDANSVIDLPKEFINEKKKLSIVFAGQYSAGKSSIVKMLTDIKDIKIGAGIATEDVTSYDWQNVDIIDTPGIDTGIRPEHDKITEQAIANADVLVFVMTSELYDECLLKCFKKYAYELDKKREMILVVNKMNRCGNTLEMQAIKKEALKALTEPETPEFFNVCFTDANDYLKSKEPKNQGRAEKLREKSGYNQLVDVLTDVIENKGTRAQMTTVAYKICHAIDNYIDQINLCDTNSNIDEVEREVLNKKNKYKDIRNNLRMYVEEQTRELQKNVLMKSKSLIDSIDDGFDENVYKLQETKVQTEVENLIGNFVKKLEQKLYEEFKGIDEDNYKLEQLTVDANLPKANVVSEPTKGIDTQNAKKFIKIGKDVSDLLVNTRVKDVSVLIGGTSPIAQLNPAKWWNAFKFSRNVTRVGSALGIGIGAVTIALQFLDTMNDNQQHKDDKKREQEIAKFKMQVNDYFYETTTHLRNYYRNQVDDIIATNLNPVIDKLDGDKISILKQKNRNHEQIIKAVKLKNEILELIKEFNRVEL